MKVEKYHISRYGNDFKQWLCTDDYADFGGGAWNKRAYEGQRDTLVEVDYVEAYRKHGRYYDKCVNDRVGQYQPLMVSSKLEREQGRAEFIGELPYHTYMFRINLTEEGEGKTRIHFIRALPTQMGWLFLNNPPSKVRQKSALEAEFKFWKN